MSSRVLPPLEELYRSHGPAVLRRARQLLGNDAEAQEVLQDVFASLVKSPEQFRGECSAMTFLYKMTTNSALGRLRQGKNRLRLLDQERQGRTDTVGQRQESTAVLRQLLGRLPEDLARIGVYYYVDEMTQHEIADVLSCSRQWVGKQLAELTKQVLAQDTVEGEA